MRALLYDLRYAWRALIAAPGYSISAVAILGLGVGVNTALFSLAYGVLFRPLPYERPDDLVRVSEYHPGAVSTLRDAALSDLTFEAWRRESRTLEGLAAYSERAYTLTGLGDAERVRAVAVSPELFGLLRLRPAAGELFGAANAAPGADAVVVLSHAFWRERFGARTDIVGRSITLDSRPYIVTGVAPEAFSFPDRERALFTPYVLPRPDVSQPPATRPVRALLAIGRLRPNITAEQASGEGTAVARGLGPRPASALVLFGEGGPVTVRVESLASHMSAGVRPTLLLLTAGVVLILVIGCANVACLSMVRGVAREREFAVRVALGASPGRLVQQTLCEGAALSITAAVSGAAIAWALIRALPSVVPSGFPRIDDVRVDAGMLSMAVGLSVVSSLIAALVPALRSAAVRLAPTIRHSGGTSHVGDVLRRQRWLFIAEAALAAVLVVGASLLVRSLMNLLTVDVGYTSAQVMTARVTLQGSTDLARRWQQLATGVVERLERLPGVTAVGASNMAPFGDTNHLIGFRWPSDRPEPLIARSLGYVVSPGHLDALQVRLRHGRLLTPADIGGSTQAFLVNEEFVRQYVPDGAAVGRQYSEIFAPKVVSEIVGVVGNVLRHSPDQRPQPEIYVPLGHHGLVATGRQINIAVRGTHDRADLAAMLRQAVRELDVDAAVHNVLRLDSQASAAVAQPRFTATLVVAFAALSLLLAGSGLYGVLAYGVSRRRRELAIRAAIGADRRSLVRLVVRDGLRDTAFGLIAGVVIAAVGARVVHGLLFNVAPLDLTAFVVAGVVLATVGFLASIVPAGRAARVDLNQNLRSE